MSIEGVLHVGVGIGSAVTEPSQKPIQQTNFKHGSAVVCFQENRRPRSSLSFRLGWLRLLYLQAT